MIDSEQSKEQLALAATRSSAGAPRWPAEIASLLQFIATLTHNDNLDQVLNQMLRRVLHQLGVKRAAALVLDRQERFVVRVARGRGVRDLLGYRTELADRKPVQSLYQADQIEVPLVAALQPILVGFTTPVIVPVRRGERLLGVLLFDSKPAGAGFSPQELDFLRLFASVTAAAVETSLAQSELRRANQQLRVRTQQLYTLFDVVREIFLAQEPAEVHRLLLTTLLNQTAINSCAVFTIFAGRLRLGAARGIEVTNEELEHLLNTTLLGAVLAQETIIRPTELLNRAGGEPLRRWGIDYLVPMRSREQTRGLLAVSLAPSRTELTEDELEFIATLSNQAIVALENLRLRDEMLIKQQLEKEMGIARRIQLTLLPRELAHLPGYELAARGVSYREVGGDYFDYIAIDDRHWALAIGDVTGKGMPAALLMSSLHATVRALATSRTLTCAEIVGHVNRLLYQSLQGESFTTFFLGILDTETHTLTSTNAGHCYPLLVRRAGEVVTLSEGGLVLGLFDTIAYESEQHRLQPGDTLVLYTDGLSEANSCLDPDVQFGDERMLAVIQANQANATTLVEALFTECDRFTNGAPLRDDTTLVVVKREEVVSGQWPEISCHNQ